MRKHDDRVGSGSVAKSVLSRSFVVQIASAAVIFCWGQADIFSETFVNRVGPGGAIQAVTLANGTWTASESPYVIEARVTIGAGAALTIESGVSVQVQAGRGIFVNGTLQATSAAFTPRDTGNWLGIYFGPEAGGSVLRGCTIQGAGGDNLGYINWAYRRAAIYVDRCSPEILQCQVLDSAAHGIELYSSQAAMVGNTFRNCGDGWYAIAYDTVDVFPMSISGNTGSGSGFSGVAIPGGTLNGTNAWQNPGTEFPYFLNGDLAVAEGAELNIAAGVTIKTDSQKILVYGALKAAGTETGPIQLTSRKVPAGAGDWKGIYFGPRAGGSVLNYVTVNYAGKDNLGYIDWAYRYTAIYVESSSPVFDHVRVLQSAQHGVELYGSDAKFSNGLISGCGGYALIAQEGSRPEISNTRLSGNGAADNGSYTVGMDAKSVPSPSGVVFEGNTKSGVEIWGGTLGASGTWLKWADNAPYIITKDVTVAEAVQLSIQSGATVKLAGAGLYISGVLTAVGQEDPILFTSWRDDPAGGDSNGDGASTTPAAGDWKGIYLSPSSGASVLRACTLRYAGKDNLGYFNWAYRAPALYINNCSPLVTNCRFENNAVHGLELYASRAEIRDNVFVNQGKDAYAMVYDDLSAFARLSGNTGSGTGELGMAVPGGTIRGTNTWNNPGPGLAYFQNGELVLAEASLLTIDPGVAVKTDNQRLLIYGTLKALGSAAEPVLFSSRKATPAAGDWRGIYFGPPAGSSVLTHVTVAYAGRDNLGYFNWAYRSAAVFVDGSSVEFDHLTILQSQWHGVELYGSASRLTGTVIQDCGGSGLIAEAGSRPAISQARFAGNGFNGTGFYAVSSDPNAVAIPTDVRFETNRLEGVQVGRGSLASDAVWRVWATNAPYVLTGDVTVDAPAKLEIAPGTVVKLAGAGIFVNGVLIADGTDAAITFTSSRDDLLTGDTNGDGAGTAAAAGDWKGIYLSPGSGGSRMNRCTVRFAGSDNLGYIHWGYRRAAVYVDSCSPLIANCQILDSAANGVELYASQAVINQCAFQNAGEGWYAMAFDSLDCFPVVSGNTASGSGNAGIYVPDGTVAASGQWQKPGEQFPYLLAGNLSIANGTTLAVGPGTQLRSASGIYVSGQLDARGTAAEPIVFGSRKAAAAPGDWKGIYFSPTAGSSVLRFCRIEHAGADSLGYFNWEYRRTSIYVESASPEFSNMTVAKSAAHGLMFYGGAAALNNSLVLSNASSGVVLLSGAVGEVANNTIAGNGAAGISGVSGSASIVNNIVAFNAAEGLGWAAGTPALRNNCVFGNGKANYSGIAAGDSDISADPQFVNSEAGNYRLRNTSPAMNAGDNAVVRPLWTDLDDHLRVVNARVDMGAYEFGAPAAQRTVDSVIRTAEEILYTGTNVYSLVEQTRTRVVNAGTAAVYYIKSRYDGNISDTMRITGSSGGSGWTLKYFDVQSGSDLTARITGADGWRWTNANPDAAFELRLEVTPGAMVPGNEIKPVEVTASSYSDPSQRDSVGADTTVARRAQADLLVRREQDMRYIGGDIFNGTGDGQTKEMEIEVGRPAVYAVQVANDGNIPDKFVIRGGGGGAGWSVRYFDALAGGQEITSQAAGNGWTVGPLGIGAAAEFRVVLTAMPDSASMAPIEILVSAISAENPGSSDTIKVIGKLVGNAAAPQGGIYTLSSDFEKGVLVGVECESIADQLQLSRESVTLPFIWVPNSNEGTVSKVDTRTGRELGRYRTGPTTSGSPSRTTVDQEGNCWVANRVAGTVVKIGLYENGQYVDRNANGTVETSRDVNGDGEISGDEMLPWGQDECVLLEIVLIPGNEGTYQPGAYTGNYANDNWNPGPRGIAVDAQDNLWLGTYGSRKFYYVAGATGKILRTNDVSSLNHTSYGALIDANGIVWSAGQDKGHVLRLDPKDNSISVVAVGHYVYGIGLDQQNHLFVSGWQDSKLSRINVLTGQKEWTVQGVSQSRGVAITDDGDVWVANSGPGTVTRWSNDGVVKATVSVGAEPTGVAVDAAGKVWVVNNGDEYIKRIDPAVNAVDLSKRIIGGVHYGYSDMTGIMARSTTIQLGLWTVTHNSRFDGTVWEKVSWNCAEPAGTSVRVRVRSSADQSIWSAWENVTNAAPLTAAIQGKYLQIEAAFRILTGEVSPVLYDLSVTPAGGTIPPPPLAIRVADGLRIEISWPAQSGAWVVESTPALGAATQWRTVTGPPVQFGDRFVLTVQAIERSQFYRLRR